MKTLFSITSFLFLYLFSFNGVYAQAYNNIWTFGNGRGLDFSTVIPSYVPVGISTLEASASVCDKSSGQLLFYCDGYKVLDRTHTIMPNGYGVYSHYSSTQGSVIAAVPGSDSLYYLFTLTDETSKGKFRYSIINMAMHGGLGDIPASQKNVFLDSMRSEKMCVGGYCGVQWLLTHHLDSPIFYAYRLTSPDRLGPPVVSRVGHDALPDFYAVGEMKFTPDFKNLILANYRSVSNSESQLEMYDFDALTGIVSNQREIDRCIACDTGYFYSFDISPLGNKLYADGAKIPGPDGDEFTGLYQYDLTAGSAMAIKASKTLLFRSQNVYGVRTGPDGMVYVIDYDNNRDNLTRIRKPELGGTACDIEYNFMPTPFPPKSEGLLFGSTFQHPLVPVNGNENFRQDRMLCLGDTVTIYGDFGFDSYQWQDGDSSRKKVFTQGDTLWLRSTSSCGIRTDTFYISQYQKDTIRKNTDTLICFSSKAQLNADADYENYQWSTGSTASAIEVESSDIYTVSARDPKNCNVLNERFNVVFVDKFDTKSKDTFTCNSDSIRLDASIQNEKASYVWTTGDTTSYIYVDTAGDKIVHIYLDGCRISDTFKVSAKTVNMQLNEDAFACVGQPVALYPDTTGERYRWSTGDTNSSIVVAETGRYTLSMLIDGCEISDFVDVVFDDCENCISIPNAFTPNNDGLNDRFKVFIHCRLSFFEIMIYSRWGEQVYYSTNQNDQWDGSFKGMPMDSGVFYYMVRIKTMQEPDKLIQFKGDISLFR